jgi:hypothetical protein
MRRVSSVLDVVTSNDKPAALAFALHALRSKLQFDVTGAGTTRGEGGGRGVADGGGSGVATTAGGVVHAANPPLSTPKRASPAAVQRIHNLSEPDPFWHAGVRAANVRPGQGRLRKKIGE